MKKDVKLITESGLERMRKKLKDKELKAKMREYMREYYQKPEVKAKMSDYNQNRDAELNIKNHYLSQLKEAEKQAKQYSQLPIPLEGKIVMLKEIIANLDIIDTHVSKLGKSVRAEARRTMIAQLLEKEGTIVSRRRKLIGEVQGINRIFYWRG